MHYGDATERATAASFERDPGAVADEQEQVLRAELGDAEIERRVAAMRAGRSVVDLAPADAR